MLPRRRELWCYKANIPCIPPIRFRSVEPLARKHAEPAFPDPPTKVLFKSSGDVAKNYRSFKPRQLGVYDQILPCPYQYFRAAS